MIKAVYFDLDNTLVHRNNSIAVYAQQFVEYFSGQLSAVTPADITKVIVAQDNGGYLPEDCTYGSIKDAVANELHKRFVASDQLTVADIRQHWIEWFPVCAVAMAGADELLAELAKREFYIGVISNGAHQTRISTASRLKAFGCIQQLVSSDSAGIRKPASQIFTQAAAEAGFTTDQCCYIGDHPVNDIQGARAAGMQAVWLKGFHPWPANLARPCYSVDSLSEVVSLVVE